MTSTPRLDRITATGTDHLFERIRLADGHTLTLKTRITAGEADEVFLLPGLTAPDTEAWRNEDQWGLWQYGGNFGEGALFLDVPVKAVRDLIEQHGGEHDDQEGGAFAPEVPSGAVEEVTAGNLATRALAAWGMTVHADEDAGNSWLVIPWDQPSGVFPGEGEPHAVLYLYDDCYPDEVMVDRTPGPWDQWRVMVADATGCERHLITRPLGRLSACVEAVADWATTPQR
jgi:hypothetical protein